MADVLLNGIHRKRDPNWKCKRYCPTAIVKRLIAWHENDGSIEDLASLIVDARRTMEPRDRTRKTITLDLSDLPGEEWRPVVGGEGKYDVSNLGRVRSYSFKKEHGWGWGDKPHHIMQGAIDSKGYRGFALKIDGHSVIRKAHDIMLLAFVGQRPNEKMVARHLNGNPGDNRLDNLRWGTQVENAADRTRHGRQGKLKPYNIETIRRELADGTATTKQLAERFKVSKQAIKAAARGRSWGIVGPTPLSRVPNNGSELNPPRGARNPKSKLDDLMVYEIKRLLHAGSSQRVISELYGTSEGVIQCINSGVSWKHVAWPAEEPT